MLTCSLKGVRLKAFFFFLIGKALCSEFILSRLKSRPK